MNYIRLLTSFYLKASLDTRLSASHMSLYLGLFQLWNQSRFDQYITINRKVLIRYTKIGSNHTFYKCLKDLHKWNYIIYKPSFAPTNLSRVEMIPLEDQTKRIVNEKPSNDSKNSNENADSSCAKSAQLSSSTCAESTQLHDASCAKSAQLECKIDIATCAILHPNINSTYINNKHSLIKEENLIQDESMTKERKRKKVAQKKEKEFSPPSLSEVQDFFIKNNFPEQSASRFFYYYDSIDWKVGGHSKIKNWHSAAHYWVLNGASLEKRPRIESKTTKPTKDYNEPL